MGFEPTTRGLKGRCSNLLSYGPILDEAKNGEQITGYIILKTEAKVNPCWFFYDFLIFSSSHAVAASRSSKYRTR